LTQESKAIIEAVRDLSVRLGIKFPVHLVRWLPPRQPSDVCSFGLFETDEVDLPRGLKGKLNADELRPLIASSMIYDFKLGRRRVIGLLVRMLGALSLLVFFVIFAAIAFTDSFGFASQAIGGTLALFFVILPVILSQWLGARLRQRQRLEADRLAAGIVGKEPMMQTLRSIDELGLHDIEARKHGGWKARFAEDPSITKRIERLSATA
jgi:hypothetical protein